MLPPFRITRRRMKLEELVAKIAQIEEHASLTLAEYPGRLSVERQRHILGLARQIRAHLEDQLRAGQRQPEAERRFDAAQERPAG
jgi:hypothetical protein